MDTANDRPWTRTHRGFTAAPLDDSWVHWRITANADAAFIYLLATGNEWEDRELSRPYSTVMQNIDSIYARAELEWAAGRRQRTNR